MKKKALIMVVVLLAISSLFAAMAFNSNYVWSAQKLSIVNTSNALVALKPGTGIGNLDKTASLDNNILRFDFGKGRGGAMYGLQPGSRYTWDKLFSITNNSKEDLLYTFGVDERLAQYITIYDGNQQVYPRIASNPNYGYIRINSGDVRDLKVEVIINSGEALTNGLNGNSIVLDTQAVAGAKVVK